MSPSPYQKEEDNFQFKPYYINTNRILNNV